METRGPIWLAYAALLLCAFLSVLLFLGKGSWLVAGYNTASKEEKAKYEEKKLCRIVGMGLGIEVILISVLLFAGGAAPACFDWLIPVLIVLDLLITIILANTVCKKK